MTLDEAIKHCEEVAEKKEKECKRISGSKDEEMNGALAKTFAEYAEEHRQLAEWLKELKRLREQTRWIPCSERLPEKEVLCCDIDNNIMLGYVFVDMSSESGFSAENENCFMYECVAWMPKPKGYNGGEKE